MASITEFLEARIAEDEAAAKVATPGPWDAMTEETGNGENIYYTVEHGAEQLCDMALTSHQGRMDAEHIARHDPARVLSECAAKRAIIRRHATITVWPDGTVGAKYYYNSKQVCASCDERTQTPCPTIGLLAAVYKDHPDYRQEWAA